MGQTIPIEFDRLTWDSQSMPSRDVPGIGTFRLSPEKARPELQGLLDQDGDTTVTIDRSQISEWLGGQAPDQLRLAYVVLERDYGRILHVSNPFAVTFVD